MTAVLVNPSTTDLHHGVKTVTTAGTDEPLVAAATVCRWVAVQAQTDNTGWIAVGGTGVDATVATGTGILLSAGQSIVLEVTDVASVYVDATVSGDGVRFTYGTWES